MYGENVHKWEGDLNICHNKAVDYGKFCSGRLPADVTSAKQQQVRGFVQPPPPATLHLRRVYDDIMNSNATRGGSGRRCVQWAPSTFALVSPVNANHVTLTSSSFSPKPPRHRRVSSPTSK